MTRRADWRRAPDQWGSVCQFFNPQDYSFWLYCIHHVTESHLPKVINCLCDFRELPVQTLSYWWISQISLLEATVLLCFNLMDKFIILVFFFILFCWGFFLLVFNSGGKSSCPNDLTLCQSTGSQVRIKAQQTAKKWWREKRVVQTGVLEAKKKQKTTIF